MYLETAVPDLQHKQKNIITKCHDFQLARILNTDYDDQVKHFNSFTCTR